MIPDIGVMIGMYIITRMVTLALDKERRLPSKILSWVTILTALLSMADLFDKGSKAIPQIHY